MSKVALSLPKQYFDIRRKSSGTLSKIIKNIFTGNKGAKIGIIDVNNENNNVADMDMDVVNVVDDEIRKASPIKTKPTRTTRTSKKPLSIMGGKSQKSKNTKTRKNIKNKK